MKKALVAFVLLLAALGGRGGVSRAVAEPLTVGVVGSSSALIWLYYIAQDEGLFKKHHADVDLIAVNSSADGIRQLAGGSLNILIGTSLTDPIRAASKGSTIVIARIEGQAPPYSMLAKPTIKRFGDLRGKLISVGGATDVTKVYAERMIAQDGLKRSDVDYVYAGASGPRFLALQSGAVDAAIVSPPYNFRGRSAGLISLGDVPDVVKNLPFAGDHVDSKWAAAHEKQLGDFLAAYQEAVDWFYDPANKQKAIDLLIKYTKATPDDARDSYDFFNRIKYFEPTGALSKAAIQAMIDTVRDLGESTLPTVQQVVYAKARLVD